MELQPQPLNSTTDTNRIKALDGLRGISIGLVLLSHAGLGHWVPGGLGVTIFFFISGYIITRLLLREQEMTGAIDVPAFYFRRAFRILPVLLTFLAVCTAYIQWYFGLFEPWKLLSAVVNFYNYFHIYFLDQSGLAGVLDPYGIVWTLAVEEHFYFIYPFLCYLLLARRHRLAQLLAVVCIAALVWRAYLVLGVGLDALPAERIYKATDTRIDSVAFGALFALIRATSASGVHTYYQDAKWPFAAGLLLLLATLTVRNEEFRQSLRYSLQGVALCLMFCKLVEQPGRVAAWLSGKTLVHLGKISYSLYLWHWLVKIVLENSSASTWPNAARHATMICVSLLVAQLSYRVLEQPMLRKGQAFLLRRAQIRNTEPPPKH